MQLLASTDNFDDHDPDNTVSLSLAPASTGHSTDTESAESPDLSPTQALFDAVSACANLHPDPTSDSDGDQDNPTIMFEGDDETIPGVQSLAGGTGLPPPMPGSGGWITADNVNDYFDEAGNPRRDITGLGAGAGNVRLREEDEVNGDEIAEEEDTKWRRTD